MSECYFNLDDVLTVEEVLRRWPGVLEGELFDIVSRGEIPVFAKLKEAESPSGQMVYVCLPARAGATALFPVGDVERYQEEHPHVTWPRTLTPEDIGKENVNRLLRGVGEWVRDPAGVIARWSARQSAAVEVQPIPISAVAPPEELPSILDNSVEACTSMVGDKAKDKPAMGRPKRLPVTQKVAAKLCGVTEKQVGKWDKGVQRPDRYPGRHDLAVLTAWAETYKQGKLVASAARAANHPSTAEGWMLETLSDDGSGDPAALYEQNQNSKRKL